MTLWLVKNLVEPVRREPDHAAEMVDQVLGGMILSEAPSPEPSSANSEWIHAKIPNGYVGYIRGWMCEPVLPSNPWMMAPGVMVNPCGLASAPEDPETKPVHLGMGVRCLGRIDPGAESSVETPWGCRLKLPTEGLFPASEPFNAGFYGGAKPVDTGDPWTRHDLRKILNRALERSRFLLNVPYLWGGLSPGGLDCSGLVNLCMGLEGWLLPRDAGEQGRRFCERGWGGEPAGVLGNEVGLAYFGDSLDLIDHVGFLDGSGGLIHASGNVHRTPLYPEPDEEGEKLLRKCRWVVTR